MPSYPYFCQLDVQDVDRAELCGETTTAASGVYFGVNTDPKNVTLQIRAQFGEDDIHNGTDTSLLDWWNDQNGIHHQQIMFGEIDQAIRAGRIVRLLIHDNGNFDPDPGGRFEHWVNITGIQPSGSGYVVHNPGYPAGHPVNYSSAQLQAAEMGAWAIWKDSATPPQGDEPLHINTKRALVRLAYRAGMGRDPESLDQETGWANQINDNGDNADGVMQEIMDSPEGAEWQAKVRAAVDK